MMAAVAVVLGVAVAVVVAWVYAPLAGWDAAAAIFSTWMWVSIASMDAAQTRAHATRDDPGQAQADLIIICAAVASLASVGVVLVAGAGKGSNQDLLAGFGVMSVALSWFTVHTLFTLRYARGYYHGAPGGIDFNQQAHPRYLDFAYLAFTIGMTFQVSDTDIQSPTIRALALRHALLSYLFGSVILATTINLVAGLASSGG
ncbi:MAG TPA: DUF1345 domain-containing protein [Polyangia bacterium]